MKRLFFLCIFLTGCTGNWYLRSPITKEPPITIHPIENLHTILVPATATIEYDDIDLKDYFGNDEIEQMRALYDITPDGILLGDEIRVIFFGRYFSDYYIQKIMEANVEQ